MIHPLMLNRTIHVVVPTLGFLRNLLMVISTLKTIPEKFALARLVAEVLLAPQLVQVRPRKRWRLRVLELHVQLVQQTHQALKALSALLM